jgi:hypothetical protein
MVALYRNERRQNLIPVAPRPEPADFAIKVRVPGRDFLRLTPRPTRDQYRDHTYWRLCLQQLHTAYRQVCAYSSIWIPTGYSVDHYRPKGRYPNLAYEWSNYRLAMDLINNNKRDSEVVLDPFVIQSGWFILDAATLWVRPEPGLAEPVRTRVQSSIDVLKLNDFRLVNIRFQIFRGYIDGTQHMTTIEEKYPFIAAEIRRQRIKTAAELRVESARAEDVPEPGTA